MSHWTMKNKILQAVVPLSHITLLSTLPRTKVSTRALTKINTGISFAILIPLSCMRTWDRISPKADQGGSLFNGLANHRIHQMLPVKK